MFTHDDGGIPERYFRVSFTDVLNYSDVIFGSHSVRIVRGSVAHRASFAKFSDRLTTDSLVGDFINAVPL